MMMLMMMGLPEKVALFHYYNTRYYNTRARVQGSVHTMRPCCS